MYFIRVIEENVGVDVVLYIFFELYFVDFFREMFELIGDEFEDIIFEVFKIYEMVFIFIFKRDFWIIYLIRYFFLRSSFTTELR